MTAIPRCEVRGPYSLAAFLHLADPVRAERITRGARRVLVDIRHVTGDNQRYAETGLRAA